MIVGGILLLPGSYAIYLEARVSPFPNAIKPFLRPVIVTYDSTLFFGGYWENRMTEEMVRISDLDAKHRAEFYAALILTMNLDSSSSYTFIQDVIKDDEGLNYLISNYTHLESFSRSSSSDRELIKYWVSMLKNYRKLRDPDKAY